MNPWQRAVEDFHEKFECGKGRDPGLRDTELRLDLIWEEVCELFDAVDDDDIIEATDALADIVYVILGAAVSWGIDLGPIFWEVHATNMKKEGGEINEVGRVMKPDQWKPPEILRLLREQGYEAHISRKAK